MDDELKKDDELKDDDELKKLEEIIWKNHGTEFYCAKGRALKIIRDKKLYKKTAPNHAPISYVRHRF